MYARRSSGRAAATRLRALTKTAHQPGRGAAAWRAATTGARLIRRSTVAAGTWCAKWIKSPMNRLGNDNGTLRPILEVIGFARGMAEPGAPSAGALDRESY